MESGRADHVVVTLSGSRFSVDGDSGAADRATTRRSAQVPSKLHRKRT
ncbi:hypothetical protein [Streptomyces sp. NPDC056982]